MRKPDSGGAQTVDRAVAILRQLGSAGEAGLRLTDLQAGTGLSKPTVHRILGSLVRHGLAEQETATRRYRLGREMAILGWSVARQTYDLRDLCQAEMRALAEETGDTSFLSVRSDHDSVCIDRKTGSYPIKAFTVDVGTRRPLGVGAGGIALIACLSDNETETVLATLNDRLKRYPNVSERVIRAAVRAARTRGFALSDGHVLAGVRGLAMPVRNPRGEAVAAISIAALRARVSPSRIDELAATLSRQRTLIERRIAGLDQRPSATARS